MATSAIKKTLPKTLEFYSNRNEPVTCQLEDNQFILLITPVLNLTHSGIYYGHSRRNGNTTSNYIFAIKTATNPPTSVTIDGDGLVTIQPGDYYVQITFLILR